MNPPWSETALSDLKTTSLTQEHVSRWNSHIVKNHFAMTVRRIVISKDGQGTQNSDAWCVSRNNDHRLLPVAICIIRIAFPHKNKYFTARIIRPRRPPFTAINHVLITIPHNRCFNIGRIRRRHRGFSHRKARTNFAAQQGLEPLFLLLRRPVPCKDFHIAGIGC